MSNLENYFCTSGLDSGLNPPGVPQSYCNIILLFLVNGVYYYTKSQMTMPMISAYTHFQLTRVLSSG